MIRLVLTDLDGTLINSKRELTQGTLQAVESLRKAGIAFVIVSGRPPLGIGFIMRELGGQCVAAAFNGGMLVRSDLSIIEQRLLDAEISAQVIRDLDDLGLFSWVYRGREWLVRNLSVPHLTRESETVRFSPTVVPDFDKHLDQLVKIVGISDDEALVEKTEQLMRERYSSHLTAARSQNYYLDITHPDANKGRVVERIAELYRITPAEIATLGDMPSDVAMFTRSGISFAMGNASAAVKAEATTVVASNNDDGFAEAVRIILGHRLDQPRGLNLVEIEDKRRIPWRKAIG